MITTSHHRFSVAAVLLLNLSAAAGPEAQNQSERDFYRRDFFLNLNSTAELQNDIDSQPQSSGNTETGDIPESGVPEQEIRLRMSDDGFVVTDEGRKREDLFLMYVLPGMMGVITLAFAWVCYRTRLAEKQEVFLTRKRLRQLQREFRGRESTPEFRNRLKEILKLPPGATTRHIRRAIPFSDREMQQLVEQHDDQFKKRPPGS